MKKPLYPLFNKSRKITATVFLSIMLAFLISLPVGAYALTGWKISSLKTFTANENFSSTSVSHMGSAVSLWNGAAGAELMSVSSSRHTYTNYPSFDFNNYVYRVDVGNGYVAQCTTTTLWLFNTVIESDININIYYLWANGAQPDRFDLYSVFLHETGHTVGLGEVYDNPSAAMYHTMSKNTLRRALTYDDISGAYFIYN